MEYDLDQFSVYDCSSMLKVREHAKVEVKVVVLSLDLKLILKTLHLLAPDYWKWPHSLNLSFLYDCSHKDAL